VIRRGVSGDWDESVESTFRVVVSVLLRRPCGVVQTTGGGSTPRWSAGKPQVW